MKRAALTIAAYAFFATSLSYAGNTCEVESGLGTAALVELYTSEGCSSCPPADRELSRLHGKAGAEAVVVPLALHVSYWDQIGWKDVFAQKIFDIRQRQLVTKSNGAFVYTPQFFVNGRELRNWRGSLPSAIRQINDKPAQANIKLKWTKKQGNVVLLEAEAATRDSLAHSALYLAISESRLVSKVLRGENSGATLMHDATVRAWFGPIDLSNGRARWRQEVSVPNDWNVAQLHAVAFVQGGEDGAVLQAVSSARCNQGREG